MNLNLSDDQLLLRDTVAKLFKTESSPIRVRAAEATGFDAKLWAQLVAIGLPVMRMPESAGGAGLGLLEAVLLAEEAGRHLASVPLAEALVAGRLLAQLGPEAAPWLERVQGGALVTLLPGAIQPGTAQVVNGATVAEALLALDGDTVVLITGAAPEAPQPNLGAAALAPCILGGPGATGTRHVLARGDAARDAFLAAVEEWKLLTAAMLAGLGKQALEMAAAYSRERQQFGRPIGGYQGIAHPLADALTEIEGAQLLVWRAIWSIAEGSDDAAAGISKAYWWATQSVARAVARALHTFGGYGVSLEYDIQLYYRRGKAWSLLAGDPQEELQRVADRLWGGAVVPLPETGELGIHFGCGKEAALFAADARRFFEENLTDALKAHAHHSVAGFHPDFNRQLAEAGLLYPHWPEEFGGQDRTPFEMAALAEVFEEFNWERMTAPITNQVAQIVMRFGTEAVKREVLSKFATGSSLACLGFSEPDAGSDVFAAKTRAVRDGDDWLINGQKIFTTAANLADYVFLLVRTNPDVAKHAGLSLFLVPLGLPGVEIQAVHTLQDERTNITYYADVRVPDRYRIGEVDGGLAVMAATLELEHGGNQYRLSYANMFKHIVHWAQETRRDGRPLIEYPDVRLRLARVAVHTGVAECLCHRAIWGVSHRVPGRAAFGPMSKLFSTEFYQRDACDLMDLAAPDSLFPGREGLGHVEIGYRQSIGMTIYGGTSEIHRSLIAEQALGMPRSRS